MRLRNAVVVLPILLLLVGCTADPEAGATPSASTTPKPTSTAPAASPSPTDPSQTQPPVPETPTTPSVPAPEGFSAAELVTLCADKIREVAPDATYFGDRASTEWLEPVSLWFVVVPKELDGQQSAAVCGIGGDKANPVFTMYGETLIHGVEEVRADLLGANDDAVG